MSLLPSRLPFRLEMLGAAFAIGFASLSGAPALAGKGSLPPSASGSAAQATASNSAAKQSREEVDPKSQPEDKSGPRSLYKLNASGGGCGNNGHGNDDDGWDESNPGKKPRGGPGGSDDDGTPGNGKGRWDNHDKGGNCGVSKS